MPVTLLLRACRPLTALATALLFAACLSFVPLRAGAAEETYEGMPAGFTEDGHPYLGSPDAPVVLEEWSDYLCPFCGRHFQQTYPRLLSDYVRPGKLRIVFRDLPLVSLHPTAPRGHVAARCAGKLGGAADYWAMHDALLRRQSEWNRLADPDPFLIETGVSLGLDENALSECLADPAVAAAVDASVAEGNAAGLSATPSFLFRTVDGEREYEVSGAQPFARFAEVADALLAGEEIPEVPEPPPPELPYWAKPEGFAPDPDRPGFNMAGDAYKGEPGPLVVIAFTDFQCPACRQHALEVQPAVDAALVGTGKVLWISKHLPLKSHPQAAIAAAAAECAGDQGLYWRMYDALFEDVDRWARPDAEAVLVGIAAEIGADRADFSECLGGRRALERVLADLYDAQGIIRSVPAFVVVQGGRGSLLQPMAAEQFVKYLEERLARAEKAGD